MSLLKRLNNSFIIKLLFLVLSIIGSVEILKLVYNSSIRRQKLNSISFLQRHRSDKNLEAVIVDGGGRHHQNGLPSGNMLMSHTISTKTSAVLLLNISGKSIKWEKETGIRAMDAYKTPPDRSTLPFILSAPIYSFISKTTLNESHSSSVELTGSFRFKFERLLMEDMYKSGFGLEPYITERGERGWMENGIVYRPSRKLSNSDQDRSNLFRNDFEAYVPFARQLFFGRNQNISASINEKEKKIILWHSKARYVPTMSKPQPLQKCPEFPCAITTDRRYAGVSSALVFAGQVVRGRPPKRSSSNQVFVFHNQEPPLAKWFRRPTFKSKHWKDIFNWTMSYRLDSDIVSHYGIIRKRPTPLEKNYTAILLKKKRLVAWMVSHCDSPGKREKYAKELSKYVPVDIYGDCGNFKCNRSMNDECAEMIAARYKFYLSFENGICPDYITEKFFRYMSMDMIVIARGSNCYSQHAPSGIFINTADFASPKQLAKTILRLDRNKNEYIDILKEKDKYMQIYEEYEIEDKKGIVTFTHYHHEAVAFCEMCQKLWNLEKNTKVIPDIGVWFDRKLCHDPTDLKFN